MQITIIGSGPGIGLAAAELFGQHGFKVALVARNETKLIDQVSHLMKEGIEATYRVADVTSEQQVNDALDGIIAEQGTPSVVLYNAFAPVFKKLEQETWESIEQQTKVNAGGAFFVLKKMLPLLKAQNAGKLFFTGGGLSLYPQPTLAALGVGKAAMRNLVLGTALAVKNTNVHIATVTIKGFVKPTDAVYNPAAIAANFWTLYNQQPGSYETEIVL